jgi:hypothetical protein
MIYYYDHLYTNRYYPAYLIPAQQISLDLEQHHLWLRSKLKKPGKPPMTVFEFISQYTHFNPELFGGRDSYWEPSAVAAHILAFLVRDPKVVHTEWVWRILPTEFPERARNLEEDMPHVAKHIVDLAGVLYHDYKHWAPSLSPSDFILRFTHLPSAPHQDGWNHQAIIDALTWLVAGGPAWWEEEKSSTKFLVKSSMEKS